MRVIRVSDIAGAAGEYLSTYGSRDNWDCWGSTDPLAGEDAADGVAPEESDTAPVVESPPPTVATVVSLPRKRLLAGVRKR